ncbi:MAG: Uncharacterized protein G01um101472_173 [Parcubacteria group bacterium Gr01-1014_72]|nr:MAG: Uncharacterized protein G01um101472_173 [Parcubacteria group bacterium Gr01-1014_72]
MNFSRTVLPNGLRLITVPMKDNPTATVLVMVEAGSKYELKEQSGLSHFLEHMCFKGTVRRPKAIDISRELDGIGAEYNAFTGHEYTGYYAKADVKHFRAVLDVVSDIYLNSTLPSAEMEKEKGVIVEEINMYRDLPHRHVQDLFLELLYGDQPAGRSILGTKETVMSFTREDFAKYRGRQYIAGATSVVVAGGVSETTVKQAVVEAFKGAPVGEKGEKEKTREEQATPAVQIEERQTDQTHLVLGVRTTDAYHHDNPVFAVLTGVLSGGMSSRLFQKLREEMGVCYYVRAEHDTYTDHGYLSISVGSDRKRVPEVVGVLIEELRRLKDEPVGEAELQKVKDHLLGSMFLSLETSDALTNFYAAQEVLRKPLEKPDERGAKVLAVSSAEVQRVANEFLKSDSLNLALVGQGANSTELIRLLSL